MPALSSENNVGAGLTTGSSATRSPLSAEHCVPETSSGPVPPSWVQPLDRFCGVVRQVDGAQFVVRPADDCLVEVLPCCCVMALRHEHGSMIDAGDLVKGSGVGRDFHDPCCAVQIARLNRGGYYIVRDVADRAAQDLVIAGHA